MQLVPITVIVLLFYVLNVTCKSMWYKICFDFFKSKQIQENITQYKRLTSSSKVKKWNKGAGFKNKGGL